VQRGEESNQVGDADRAVFARFTAWALHRDVIAK
jgi:hypothetical protein